MKNERRQNHCVTKSFPASFADKNLIVLSKNDSVKKGLLFFLLFSANSLAQAERSNLWTLPPGASQTGREVRIAPEKPDRNAVATQRIPGPFQPGELLRFSADVELKDITDEKGNRELQPFDLNLHPRNVCLAVAQIDAKGRVLCAPASERALGSKTLALKMDTVIQQDTHEIELRLMATYVTGSVRFNNIRLERIPPSPLQDLPETRVLSNPNGVAYWTVHGKAEPPAIYFGNNQFNRDDRILEEMHKAYDAGLRIFSFNLYLPSMVSETETLRMIERFMEPFPDAFFIPRVWVGPGRAWQQSFPGERMRYADGQTGGYASASSEKWMAFTEFNLRELVRLIRRSPYASQCIGFKLTYYQTGEWIFWDPHRAAGFDEPTRLDFIRWLRDTYGSVQNLNAAWGTTLASFDHVTVPNEEERNAGDPGLFRDPALHQQASDFSLFYGTANARALLRFARTIKEATDNRSLTLTFYGYPFELAWHEKWPQQAGHLGLEKLYRSPDIDVIGAPYSYHPSGRGFGLPVDLHGPFDGANSFGKMVMIEEDTFTHLAEKVPETVGGLAPGYGSRTRNMEETLAVLQRNLGVAVARNQVLLWQNLFSEGRFNDPHLWNMYSPFLAWMRHRTQTAPLFAPQVAVLADPTAVTHLKTDAYGFTERLFYQPRFFLNRVDASIGYFHLSEIDSLPDSVRVLVLLTPWSLTEDQKDTLRQRFLRDGRMVISCGTGGFDGIRLAKKTGTIFPESRWKDGTLFGRRQFGLQDDQPIAPYWVVDDPDARILARYTETGEPSCAIREMDEWTAVFLASPAIPPKTWRALFRTAGCHLYLSDDTFSADFNQPDFIQVAGDFLMIQSAIGGRKEISLPTEAAQITRMDGETPGPVAESTRTFHADLDPGIPALFLLRGPLH